MNYALKTRVLSMILAVVMVIGMVPMNVFATETETESTTPETVIVKFDVNGGFGEYEDQEVILGDKIAKPAQNPTHETDTFAFWTADLEANEEWNFEEDVVTEAMTLYASWLAPVAEPEATEHTHAGGTATCKEQAICEECGEAYGELVGHTPNEDGTICTVCETVLVEEEPEHVHAGGTATCKEQAICEECGEAYGELAEHTPAEDDGDCTTEIACTVCGEVTTDAAETHTPGEVENICAVCGEEIPAVLIEADDLYGNGYYSIVSEKNWELAPGVVESEVVLNNATGDRRQVLHVVEVDIHNEYTKVIPSSKGMTPTAGQYGTQTMDKQLAYAEENGYGNVVAAMNISLSWYDSAYYDQHPELIGEPLGYLILDGVQYTNSQGKTAGAQTCLVINFDEKDGVARPSDIPKTQIRSTADAITGWEEQVIPANFTFTVKDGKLVNTKDSHDGDSAPRSMLGIKADGTIVMVMNDGRQAPYSTGFNSYEMGETMLELGCVWAINGDGGGSSQFYSQRPGEAMALHCSPSDGAPRATTHGVLVITTAPSTGEFVRASVETEHAYYTPGTAVQFQATGSDLAGSPAEIPEDAVWQLTDDTMGSIDNNGLFTSNGTTGVVTAQLIYKDAVVGSATINIVTPDAIAFDTAAAYTVPFGESVTLKVTATYGVYDVALKAEDYTITLEDTTLGTLVGDAYTAGENAGNTNMTVTLNANPAVSKTIPLTVGKGSEVIFNFEEGTEGANLENWKIKDHENKHKTYADLAIVTAENGMVHNGETSLAVHMPMYTRVHGGEGYAANSITWMGDPILLENATAIGMWVYIPEEATQTEIALNYTWYNDTGKVQRTTPDLCLNDVFNDQEYSGWHYLSVPISKPAAYIENSEDLAAAQGYKRNFFLKFYVTNSGNAGDESSYMGDITYYIDDITIDYSDAVADRVNPTIGATYAKNISSDLDVTLTAGTVKTVNSGELGFTAEVADNIAIDPASACVYVDGKAISASYKNGRIISADVSLDAGVHHVVYKIADTLGNVTKAVRYISVAGDDIAVNVVPRDTEVDVALTGSVYWVDVVANNAENIDKITLKLDLDTMHTWQLNHAELAYNYDMQYYYASVADQKDNLMTIVLTNKGSEVSGSAVIASLPIRVWSFIAGESEKITDPTEAWTAGSITAVSVNVEVEYGEVIYDDGTNKTFSAEKIHVDTEAYVHSYIMDKTYKANNTYHVHNAAAIDDVAATCTTNGYTGRTFCEVCNSPVVWGETLPATGHSYDFIDGVLKCTCGKLFTGVYTDGKAYVDGIVISDGWVNDSYYRDGVTVTGVQKVSAPDCSGEFYYDFGETGTCAGKNKYSGIFQDGELYRYAYMGVLTSGWQTIEGEWYYFSSSTMAAAQGKVKVDGQVFEFEEDGKLVSGIWVYAFNGYRYYYGPGFYGRHWYEIDGNWYFFKNGLAITGYQNVFKNGDQNSYSWYYFDETGACQGQLNGIHKIKDRYQYFEDGLGKKQCLFELDGNYYFADADGYLVTNQRFYAYATNCDLPVASYYFDEEGKMIGASAEGEIVTINDTLYYYVNGRPNMAGLIKIGEDFYFADVDGVITVGSAYVWKTNDYVTEGRYLFAQDGKMVGTGPDGVVVDIDGVKYYYKDGAATYAGLMVRDGHYYYAGVNGVLATGAQTVTKTNGLLAKNTYYFDAEGRMLGIQIVDGVTVVGEIVDGVYYKTGRPTAAGLVEYEGYFYFADANGKIATGMSFVWRTNGLLDIKEDHYYFSADGKLYGTKVVDGEVVTGEIVSENGGLYYYECGKTAMAGLVELDGYYYFADVGGKIVTGRKYVWKTNGLLPEGSYTFDDAGKMLGAAVEDGIVVSGEIVEIGGTRYYYKNGNPTPAGLVEVDGYFYFAGVEGKIATGRSYVWKNNGILPMDNYQFGTDGKMLGMRSENGEIVAGEIVAENGGLYYYECGKTAMAGLVELDGYYYFADVGGVIVTGRKYVWKTNGIIPEQSCYFDAEGKMAGLKIVDGEKVVGEIIELDGVRYYYENGVAVPAGLVEVDGYFYFADVGGVIATGRKYVWKTNGIVDMDTYYFHEDGRMKGIKVVEDSLVVGEIVNEDGTMYYYESGKPAMAGLVELDGYYYFADVGGVIATGRTYVWKTNGIIPEQSCYFDAEGKMAGLKIVDGEKVVGEIIEIDGVRYYYENGAGVRKGIVYIDGYYYFANTDGKLVVNQKFYVWKEAGNGLLADELHYTFDELGRVIG